jgi:hypothetical protein
MRADIPSLSTSLFIGKIPVIERFLRREGAINRPRVWEYLAMAENEIKNWEAARMQLVKQRQGLIRTLAEGYERERENLIDYLIKIQAGIDALDKAKHEIFTEEGHEVRPK